MSLAHMNNGKEIKSVQLFMKYISKSQNALTAWNLIAFAWNWTQVLCHSLAEHAAVPSAMWDQLQSV